MVERGAVRQRCRNISANEDIARRKFKTPSMEEARLRKAYVSHLSDEDSDGEVEQRVKDCEPFSPSEFVLDGNIL